MGRLLCANLATTFSKLRSSQCSAGTLSKVEDGGERNASNVKMPVAVRALAAAKTVASQVVDSGTKSAATTSPGWTCERKGDDRKTFRWCVKSCARNNGR